jgi:hypothetical protein
MTWVLVLTIWFNGEAANIHSVPGFSGQAMCETAGQAWQRGLTISTGGYKRFVDEHSSYACLHTG